MIYFESAVMLNRIHSQSYLATFNLQRTFLPLFKKSRLHQSLPLPRKQATMSYNTNYHSSSSTSRPRPQRQPDPEVPAQVPKRNNATFSCPHCPSSFISRRYLSTHMRDVHGERIEHECSVCFRIFCNASFLEQHSFDCNPRNRESAACRDCGRTFANWAEKNEHHWNVHVKQDIRPSDTRGGPQPPMSDAEYEYYVYNYGLIR